MVAMKNVIHLREVNVTKIKTIEIQRTLKLTSIVIKPAKDVLFLKVILSLKFIRSLYFA